MTRDDQALKAVPVRRRSAARLGAVQVCYQGLMSARPTASIATEFLQHYAADVIKSFRVKDLDHQHFTDLCAGMDANAEALDAEIAGCLAKDWSLETITLIERALVL